MIVVLILGAYCVQRHTWPFQACVALIGLLCLVASTVASAAVLNQWRNDYIANKQLAKNDILAAYDEVQRLGASMPATAEATDQVNLLNLQSRISIALAMNEQATEQAERAMALALATDYTFGQVEAQLNFVRISLNQGKILRSVEAAVLAMELVDELDNPVLQSEAMFWLSMAYRRIGHMSESVNLALRALDIAKASKNPRALVYAHHGLALSFEQSGRPDDAYKHFSLMYEYAQKSASKLYEADALQGMATTRASASNLADEEKLMEQVVARYRSLHAPMGLGVGLYRLADIYRQQGRHADMIPLLNEVVDLYQRHPNQMGLWYSLNARSDSFQVLGNIAMAHQDAERAHLIAQEIDEPFFLIESTLRKASVAAAGHNYELAYRLSQRAAFLDRKAELEQSGSQIVDLVERYELNNKRREIEALNQYKEQQAMEITQRALQQRWLWTVLLSSLLLVVVTAYFLYRLRRSNFLLRGLASRLETVREEECKRIARDLHDELGQCLTAMRLEVSGIRLLCDDSRSPIISRARNLNGLIDQTIGVVRDIAASLRPAALDMGGMSSLEWLVEEFVRRAGVDCSLDIGDEQIELRDEYMTAIFRIVQESLTNVARHAKASRVNIVIRRQTKTIQLEISDNGKGFNTGQIKPSSYGLIGMRERVLMLGGEMTITSKPGSGTTVKVGIPIRNEDISHD